jgi:hypothetical protein
LPSAAGDAAATSRSLGAIILDGYSRAYVLNLANTLQKASLDHPLSRALQNGIRVSGGQIGPISIGMTVSERHDLAGYALQSINVGPVDLRRSRLIAGAAIAHLDNRTAVAFGFAEGAKAMERRLTGANAGLFLIAADVGGTPGFSAKRNSSLAVRHEFAGLGVTTSGETGDVWQDIRTSATGSPYRLVTIAIDKSLGRNFLSLGTSRLEEAHSLLGGRLSLLLGGRGGAATTFLDAEACHEFGGGWSTGITARRGWTDFAGGKFQTGAYAFDVSKLGLLSARDSIGLRIAQPLRVEHGGFAMKVPTSWDYVTETATYSATRMSLSPSGRETDGELSYGSSLLRGNGWFGANLFYRPPAGSCRQRAERCRRRTPVQPSILSQANAGAGSGNRPSSAALRSRRSADRRPYKP